MRVAHYIDTKFDEIDFFFSPILKVEIFSNFVANQNR